MEVGGASPKCLTCVGGSFRAFTQPMKWFLALLSLAALARAADGVVINEIHFDPAAKRPLDFIELHNTRTQPVNIGGWTLEKFKFPPDASIPAGGYAVVAKNPEALEKEFGVRAFGPLPGRLSNEGEKLKLRDADGKLVEEIKYGAGFPWPTASVGAGSSIERIYPTLDGTVPGNWRASGFPIGEGPKPKILLRAGDAHWRWRKGTQEASQPRDAWRRLDFKEDANWQNGTTSIGYGDDDDATVLNDMQGRYSCIFLRHTLKLDKVPPALLLRVRVDDGCIVWLNGTEAARLHVLAGELRFDGVAQDHEATEWEEVLIPNTDKLLAAGDNMIAVQAFNASRNSSDLTIDVSLQTPEGAAHGKRPTPGAQNSVFARNAPPAISRVGHEPAQPKAGEPVKITAHISDPDGVGTVTLHVQAVDAGAYLRKSDPDFETRWQDVLMHDDGANGDATAKDGVFTAVLPANLQTHRRLVRYRITASDGTGLGVRVPYPDDECPNFAYFVSNGIPTWTGAFQPGKTPPLTFTPEFQRTLPNYTLIANGEDVARSQWDGSYDHKRMTGTLILDGDVFDHITFHNRGRGSTHVTGKNKWGFHFARAREFHATDPWGRRYPHTWNSFVMNACASPWVQVNRGMAGLDEAISFRCYQLAGVPAPNTHSTCFRVITSAAEQGATQFESDLWGLYLVIEDPDGAWLANHELPRGIVATHESEKVHAPSGLNENPRELWQKFASGPQGKTEPWWRANMDLPAYFGFHAINRLVSNVDVRPAANHYFYGRPEEAAWRWAPVPWDLDMMFIPRTHQPGYIDQARCLEVPAIRTEYRNRAREILDLLASDASPAGGQIGQVIVEYARNIAPAGQLRTWAELDATLWNFHPRTQAKGEFYRNSYEQEMMGGKFRRTLSTPDFAGFCKYIADFCTDSRPSHRYAINDGNPLGYGWGYLNIEANDPAIPARPTITYKGAPDFPSRELIFQVSPFASAKGGAKFASLQWRAGEIGTPADGPWRYEIEPHWISQEITEPKNEFHLPADACPPGRTFRVRARYKDATGRWSHWSEPIQFTAR